jgi:uncharacterized membrane protein
MDADRERRFIDISYDLGLVLKGINAVLEIVFGVTAIFITQAFILHIAAFMTQDELLEDPKDVIANYVLNAAHHFSIASKDFLIFYFLSHGVIKHLLVIGLWKKKLWAYPASLIVFSLFIVYQLYRFSFSHSIWLIVLSVFDLLVLWLIWKEYSYVKMKLS